MSSLQQRALHAYATHFKRIPQLCIPDPLHTCSMHCVRWKVPTTSTMCEDVYVCRRSHNVHTCGRLCRNAVVDGITTETICTLTGVVIDTVQSVVHVTFDENNNVTSDHPTQRKPVTLASAKTEEHLPIFKQALIDLFTSKIPKKRYTQKVLGLRHKFKCTKTHITYMEVESSIHKIFKQHGYALEPPLDANDKMISLLAHAILKYWMKFFKHIKNNVRNKRVFTAAVVERLKTGCIVQGVVFFPKIEFVARYAPDETLAGQIIGIRISRFISTMDRMIYDMIMRTNIPDVNYIFQWDGL